MCAKDFCAFVSLSPMARLFVGGGVSEGLPNESHFERRGKYLALPLRAVHPMLFATTEIWHPPASLRGSPQNATSNCLPQKATGGGWGWPPLPSLPIQDVCFERRLFFAQSLKLHFSSQKVRFTFRLGHCQLFFLGGVTPGRCPIQETPNPSFRSKGDNSGSSLTGWIFFAAVKLWITSPGGRWCKTANNADSQAVFQELSHAIFTIWIGILTN